MRHRRGRFRRSRFHGGFRRHGRARFGGRRHMMHRRRRSRGVGGMRIGFRM